MTLKYGTTTYDVVKCDEPDGKLCMAYELKGPRGGHYGLMRNQKTPTLLFAINLRKFTGSTPFEWARESEDGLEVLR